MPFHPLFLQKLSVFKTIRFMDWAKQDGVIEWSDRITPRSYAAGHGLSSVMLLTILFIFLYKMFFLQGVAYEYQIQLCNILKTNCWVTVPYAASDDFIKQMAILFMNNLRKDVTVDLEYSNEVWNTLFNAGIYAVKMGLQLGLSTDEVIARNLFYSLRVQQMIKIWQNVFQNEQYRINLIVGTFKLMPVNIFSDYR